MFFEPVIRSLLLLVTITTYHSGYSITDPHGDTFTCGKNMGGFQENYTNRIGICDDIRKPEEIERVILHEMGHYVYFSKLTNGGRERWERIFEGQGRDKAYAYEAFAEYFRMRIQDNVRKYDPEEDFSREKERFMGLVFRELKKYYGESQ